MPSTTPPETGQVTVLAVSHASRDPAEWQRVAKDVAKAMSWSTPEVAGAGDPAPTPGWAV